MKSLKPMAVSIDTIVLGNILAVSPTDIFQLAMIGIISLVILFIKWKDMMVTFFDENHARSIGINTKGLKILFFALLAASTVAAMQTVGAFLVISLVVTPGATAYLITDRFQRLIVLSVVIGILTSIVGVYLSYLIHAQTGGVIVLLQALLFALSFFFAPKHGFIAARLRAKKVQS